MASNGGDEYGTKKVTLFRHKGSESEGNSSRASSRSGTVKDRSQIDPSLPEHGWRELETIKKYYETQSRAWNCDNVSAEALATDEYGVQVVEYKDRRGGIVPEQPYQVP